MMRVTKQRADDKDAIRQTWNAKRKRRLCHACGRAGAAWVVRADPMVEHDPGFLCDLCLYVSRQDCERDRAGVGVGVGEGEGEGAATTAAAAQGATRGAGAQGEAAAATAAIQEDVFTFQHVP